VPDGWVPPPHPVGFQGVALALIHFSQSLGATLALIATFGGIGLLVNLLIVYIVLQVLAERRENQERQQSLNR
jgi:predicted transporter